MLLINDKSSAYLRIWHHHSLQRVRRDPWLCEKCKVTVYVCKHVHFKQAGDTRIPLPRESLWTSQEIVDCKVGLCTSLRDCRWISITILYVSFTNSATVRRLAQVQLCNRLIDQSADNITGLKCAKECLILKYKYIQNPCFKRLKWPASLPQWQPCSQPCRLLLENTPADQWCATKRYVRFKLFFCSYLVLI